MEFAQAPLIASRQESEQAPLKKTLASSTTFLAISELDVSTIDGANERPQEKQYRFSGSQRLILVSGALLAILTTILVGIFFLVAPTRHNVLSEEEIIRQAAALAEDCQRLKARSDWRRLEQAAQQWGELQPKRLEPWLMAADAARRQGDVKSVAHYLSLTPDDCPIEVLTILGQLQLEELNEPLAAVDTFKRTLTRYPHDLETHMRLLQFYSMTCQRELVIEQARQCIASGRAPPAVFAFLFAARWLVYSNGYDINNQWMRSGENDELFEAAATVHLFVHPELKKMAQAARSDLQIPTDYFEYRLREALNRYPKNRELLAVQLRQLAQRGDVSGVATILAEASNECGNDPRFWYFHGWYHSAKGNWDQARQAYQRALDIDPYDWLTWNELATLARQTEGLEAAQPLLEIALLGRDVTNAVRMAENMDSIPKEEFENLAKYLVLCGDAALAEQLRVSLRRHQPSNVTGRNVQGAES